MSTPDQDRLVIRAYREAEDKNFILNSWLKSYRRAPWSQYVPNEVYFHGARRYDLSHEFRMKSVV